MRETPPFEGKFFCKHVAGDICDLVEISERRKRFCKTVLARALGGRRRAYTRLLEYYSCRECFVSLRKRADEISKAEKHDRMEYKLTGSAMTEHRRVNSYNGYLGSYSITD